MHSQDPWRQTLQQRDNLVTTHCLFHLEVCLTISTCAYSSLTRCCSPERWWILEGNVVPCAHRNTEIPPHSGCHPTPYPLRNKHGHVTNTSIRAPDGERVRYSEWRLPGHVQPSTHSSLQTSWMLRLWQVVEQDLVHSLYCIPIGHLGT